MKKLVLLAVLVMGFSAMAIAADEELPAVEIFGGYSLLNCDPGAGSTADCLHHGWNASAHFVGNSYLGVVADIAGQYGSIGAVDASSHSFLFGPRVTIRKGKLAPFAQFLLGGIHSSYDGLSATRTVTSNDFAMAMGGGLDVKASDKLSIRPFQMEYFARKSGGDFMNNLRFSVGVVYSLGKR